VVSGHFQPLRLCDLEPILLIFGMFNHIHRPTPHASDGGRASQKGDGVGRWGEIASWRDG